MQQASQKVKSQAFLESSFSKISDAYDPDLLANTLILVCFIGTLGHIGFIFLFMSLGIPALSLFNLLSVVIWLTCFYTIQKKWFNLSISILAFEVVLHATIVTAAIGTQAGFHYYLWPLMTLLVLIPSSFKMLFFGLCFVVTGIFVWLVANFSELEYQYEFEEILGFIELGNIFLAACSFIIIMRMLLNARTNSEKKLFEMANMDDFTQTYNRRFIYSLMSDKNKSETQANNYALVLADIDNFKRVNDNFGHAAGEQIILEVTKVLKANIKKTDILARWGGQEFLFILNDISKAQVIKLLEDIQFELCRKVKKPSDTMDDVSFSYGVALNTNGKSFDVALQKADLNLHRAKEQGKDGIVIDDEAL